MIIDIIINCLWIVSVFTIVKGSWYLQTREESSRFLASDLRHDTFRDEEVNIWPTGIDNHGPSTHRKPPCEEQSCGDVLTRSVKRARKGALFRISMYRTRHPPACLSCVNGFCSSNNCRCNTGWTGRYCNEDIDDCDPMPCVSQNTGECIDGIASYTCKCKSGYTGKNCELDIDECKSNPCQNGATCKDFVNFFQCDCAPRFYGVLCDTGICRPLPADVVFVLDSSVSMTESQFNKQLEFVSNFSDEVKLGHRDFQISVITYSFDAHIEFYLDQYRDNVTLKEAIANITYKPGITNTHLGLEAVRTVFGPNNGGDIPRYNNTQADRFVYLLTDGMSNDRRRTAQIAKQLKDDLAITISAIGIGPQISHKELYDIATKTTDSGETVASVYSVDNFSSLYTVLKELVQVTCEECSRSKKSNVALLVDKSFSMTDKQLELAKVAVSYVVDRAELGELGAQFSLTTFGASVDIEFGFDSMQHNAEISAELNRVLQKKSTDEVKVDMADVFNFIKMNVLTNGRSDARNFIIFVGNGNYTVGDERKFEVAKTALRTLGVEIIVIGTGSGVSMAKLGSLTWDPFNVYIASGDMTCDDGSCDNLSVIQSYFTYSDCDLE